MLIGHLCIPKIISLGKDSENILVILEGKMSAYDKGEIIFHHNFNYISIFVEVVVEIALFHTIWEMSNVDPRDGQAAWKGSRESLKIRGTFILSRAGLFNHYPDLSNGLAVHLFDSLVRALWLNVLNEREVILHKQVDDFSITGEHLKKLFSLHRAVESSNVDSRMWTEVDLVSNYAGLECWRVSFDSEAIQKEF